ncbi:MAG: hypothetical protein PHY30_00915 [Candidatus Pacebacteria bacterium]|nr:hypothetical protein [Candidatus Paceibacterota bacterium]
MPIKKNIVVLLLIIFAVIFTIILYNKDQSQEIDKFANTEFGKWASVLATGGCSSSNHNITGWAYADPIGAISLNCGNTGESNVDYGVNINESFSPGITCSGTIECDVTDPPVYAGSQNYYHVRIKGIGNGGEGTITIPDDVYSVDLTVVGGGAAGGAQFGASSGGAGGYVVNRLGYVVNPGDVISVTVGAGGVYSSSDTNSKKGKGSVFGSIQTGDTDERSIYSSGGSGGGYGYTGTSSVNGGPGGSDGYPAPSGGNGQYPLKTTSEIDKLLYSGGGGGGTSATGRSGGVGGNDYSGKAGAGGCPPSTACQTGYNGQNAKMHTGSGGGGGAFNTSTKTWGVPGKGGSGVIIVRYLKPKAKELSGYAWSPAIGPISFNASQICAGGNCFNCPAGEPCADGNAFPDNASIDSDHVATVEWVKDGVAQITGWARALGACDFDPNLGYCTTNGAGSNSGGWDGWIKFDKTDILSTDDRFEYYISCYPYDEKIYDDSKCKEYDGDEALCNNISVSVNSSPKVQMCEYSNELCKPKDGSCHVYSYANVTFGQTASASFCDYIEPKRSCGGGEIYNTVIENVEGIYYIRGNAWGGDLLDTRTPPSAILGEIVFLNAETTYDPNNACPSQDPIANFSLACRHKSNIKNGIPEAVSVANGGTCYFDRLTNSGESKDVGLVNTSVDPDDKDCNLLPNTNIKTSTWTSGSWLNNSVSKKEGSMFYPTSSSSYKLNTPYDESIKLEVEDYQGQKGEVTYSFLMVRATEADFSCCVGNDCTEPSDFKECSPIGLGGVTVAEGEKLYLMDKAGVVGGHYTKPSAGASMSGGDWIWTYSGGSVEKSGDTVHVTIFQDATIKLKVGDSEGVYDETQEKALSSIFSKIIKNPDFKEIPFD